MLSRIPAGPAMAIAGCSNHRQLTLAGSPQSVHTGDPSDKN